MLRFIVTLISLLNFSFFVAFKMKGLASYCKAETTFTFHFSCLTLSSAFLSINDREMKSESGFSFAMASKPFSDAVHNLYQKNSLMDSWKTNTLNPYLGLLLLFIKSLCLKFRDKMKYPLARQNNLRLK